MKDPLFDTLAERFADHTVDVDPGTWSAISGKLAVANGSSLSELLQEKFNGHEAPVDPQVWTNISSQLGHGAAAGVGSTAGWWAAGIAATLVAGGVLVYSLTAEPAPSIIAEQTQVVSPCAPEQQSEAAPFTSNTPEGASTATPEAAVLASSSQVEAQPNRPAHANMPVVTAQPATVPADNGAASGHANNPTTTPAASAEGAKTVNTVLQDIVDNYVTSMDVVATEPTVPAPSQVEMPSAAVHVQHEATEPDVQEYTEPELIEVPPAATFAVMIPTAFSPNNDDVNDELIVTVQNYQKASVRIFSASNNALVFSADNLEAKWDGTIMNGGQLCEPGMYFYALEVTDGQGRTWSKAEVVRLFRQ